jgi:hypothetical protein
VIRRTDKCDAVVQLCKILSERIADLGLESDATYGCGKQRGAIRRTSMELTRALAELRRDWRLYEDTKGAKA